MGILLLTASSVFTQEAKKASKPAGSREEAVLKAEQTWQDALLKSDVAALESLYSDKLIYTHSNGSVDNKKTYIESIKSGSAKYESMKRDEIKVDIYGNTALVTCHWQVSFSNNGNKVNANARYLHAYVLQNGRWQMVAHQATRIIQ
jgi:ketosteroid isomerase-like protein